MRYHIARKAAPRCELKVYTLNVLLAACWGAHAESTAKSIYAKCAARILWVFRDI